MCRTKLVKLRIHDFKGIKNIEYEFGDKTVIQGRNGKGKTTVATAWYFLLFNKDYGLRSNPNITPDDMEESEPWVEAVLNVNGVDNTIRKTQKRKVGKPNADGISKVSFTNTYTINDVPKTERDFNAWFEEKGINLVTALALSHPEVFISQKASEMRSVLFGLTKEKTDKEIASQLDNANELCDLLENYSLTEIEAMQKASKKKADEKVSSIPDIIIGMENSKVDIDVPAIVKEQRDVEERIKLLEFKKNEAEKISDEYVKKTQRIMELKFQINDIEGKAEAQSERAKQEAELEYFRHESNYNRLESDIAMKEAGKKQAIAEKNKLASEYKKVKAEKFPETWNEPPRLNESDMKCPTCGQNLPQDLAKKRKSEQDKEITKARQLYENRKAKFEKNQEKCLEDIITNGKKMTDLITMYDNSISMSKKDLKEKKKLLDKATEAMNADYSYHYDENQDYQLMKAELDKLLEWKETASEADTTLIDVELANARKTKDSLLSDLSMAENNVRIDNAIEEKRTEQRKYEQAKADAEKILYQISEFSKKRNELLTDEINEHFSIVKFKLFEFLKNGNYSEVCIPTINGRKFGESLNNGAEIVGKIDICESLQRAYDCYLPIFLDNAECLNDSNVPDVDTQLIRLKVTEDEEVMIS